MFLLKLIIPVLLFFIALISTFNSGSEYIEEQKKIIAVLSGYQPTDEGIYIKSRSKKQERTITRNYLSQLIKSIGLKPELQTYRMPNINPLVDLLFDPFKGANVYTILPSTSPSDVYVVLGAHFDTERYCPGAIDNGSGIVIGFSVLKKLKALKERNINVVLVYFDQEEEELVGSQAFAKKLKKEGFNVLSVHTFDTIGWDGDGDYAVELELPTDALKTLYTKKGKELNIPVYTNRVNSTDHQSFRELGFNATGLTDELANGDFAPYKDTPKDTYETVNYAYVASCTELVYQVVKDIVQ